MTLARHLSYTSLTSLSTNVSPPRRPFAARAAAAAVMIATMLALTAVVSRRYAHQMQQTERLKYKTAFGGTHCDVAMKSPRRPWRLRRRPFQRSLCVPHEEGHSKVAYEHGVNFVVVGDWGRDGYCCQTDVALEMARLARKTNVNFVVSAGDNFYANGIVNADDAQITRSWRDVFMRFDALRVPWKATFGNHDYMGNVSAQMALWNLSRRYYFETYGEGNASLLVAYLDSTVMYYNATEKMAFSEPLEERYAAEQVDALQKALRSSSARWKVVVAHHPLFCSGESGVWEKANLMRMRRRLLPTLRAGGVHAYISGHEHLLEHAYSDGIHFFVSGAGSKLSTVMAPQKESQFVHDRQGFVHLVAPRDARALVARLVDMHGRVVHTVEMSN